MAPKHQNVASSGSATKKKEAISMEMKYHIIKRSEKGETNAEIAHALGIGRTTVLTIVEDKERVLEYMKGCASVTGVTHSICTTRLGKQHNPSLVEMERLLMVWLEDQNQRNVPVSLSLIQEKARELHKAIVLKRGEGSGSEPFVASRGWFKRFKSRANLHNLKLHGEAASADQEAADIFSSYLAEIIRDGGYTADQVFNVDETGLFWKRMPGHTYVSKEEKRAPGHKVIKERLTLLLGSNASGDFKIRPLSVYLAENPRPLKGIFKPQLPGIWKASKKARVTVAIFEEWFNDHFLPAIKSYLKRKGLPFKVLLVLDSALGHPSNLGEIYPNVKVVYFPPNTTSLLQPMDQGVIASFRAYYTRTTVRNVLRVIEDRSNKMDVKQVWKDYSYLDAVKNIKNAWNEVKQSSLNGAWKKLCPNFVMDFTGFKKGESLDAVTKKIVQYSRKLNLEVEAEDVTELLQSHGEELSADDLIELEQQMIEEDEEAPSPKPRAISATSLSQALARFEQGLAMIEEEDPNVERFMKFQRVIQGALTFYKETLRETQMKRSIQSKLELHRFKKSPAPPATLNPEELSNLDSTAPVEVHLS
ncbi:tigger transposable element-derived protein 1-like [Macrobrachium rosenbergii]|uniref:tigger transposable element-derived protein 1-like n=1 Tax=Macrobrachium rosenbergii TaxID=79674 RepID=UPI0034D3B4D9